MKLDKTSYYPKSNLDDDDSEEWLEQKLSELSDVDNSRIVVEKREPIEPDVINNSGSKQDDDNSQFLEDDGLPDTPFNNFINGVCTVLSWALVPLLMPLYGMLIAFNYSILNYMPASSKWVFSIIVFGFTVVIPMLLIVIMKRLGIIHDIGLNGRKERLIPYLITIISMGGTAVFMWHKGAPVWMNMFLAAGALAGFVNMLINFKWKISAHAAGIAGIVALIIRILSMEYHRPDTNTLLLVAIFLAGLLGSARIWQGRHTMWQVLAGYVVGFTSVILLTLT